MRTIYLAAGCFWGAEAYFRRLPGIIEVEVGYANGLEEKTNYQKLKYTGHAETVKLVYDENQIKTAEVLDRYYRIIDPTSINRQGNDCGTQYRTGIYYQRTDQASEKIIAESLALLQEEISEPLAIEFQTLKNYVRAEDYHQDYLTKNPQGYCHINPNKAFDVLYLPNYTEEELADLKKRLSRDEFKVTQEQGTEAPHSSPYNAVTEAGIYVDVVTGQPLFSSDDKYDAGCGWPSFTMPITTDVISYTDDYRFNMLRTEVSASYADTHLGHVFSDGPEDRGGQRYCINGISLRFIPVLRMREFGYAKLLPYIENKEIL